MHQLGGEEREVRTRRRVPDRAAGVAE